MGARARVRSLAAGIALLASGLTACGGASGEAAATLGTGAASPPVATTATRPITTAQTTTSTTTTTTEPTLPATTATPGPSDGPVQVGLERLSAPEAWLLRHKRVGLIANAASVTQDGTPSLDVLRAHGIRVRRLFTPEHGLSGTAAAGASQASGIDPTSGLPFVSLYGDHLMPTPKDLTGLDALVYDLQDAGVRFFTYVTTELYAMRAAAGAGIPFVVLDRPDPLGGELVAGPVSQRRQGFVSAAPGPLVYGLTAGEMARYVNSHSDRKAKLVVIPMSGWHRDMTWARTGRRWVPPSPNLRSAQAALLYPGTALLEGTNLSEGRGTSSPFQTICAPWLDTAAVITKLRRPGITMAATTVVPKASAAAPAPKFLGTSCKAIHFRVTGTAPDGFRLGLDLIRAVRHAPKFAWLDIDTLLGTSQVRRALDRGASTDAIVSAEATAVRAWRIARESALLYP